jgi:hypothetical protein
MEDRHIPCVSNSPLNTYTGDVISQVFNISYTCNSNKTTHLNSSRMQYSETQQRRLILLKLVEDMSDEIYVRCQTITHPYCNAYSIRRMFSYNSMFLP